MGIQIYNSAGVQTLNTDDLTAGIFGGLVTVPPNSSLTKEWPLLAGCTVRALLVNVAENMFYPQGESQYIDYALGYPRFYCPYWTPTTRTYAIWVTGTPSITNFNGISAVSSTGTIAISPNARGMNFVGVASYTGAYGWQGQYQIAWYTKPIIVPRMVPGYTIGAITDLTAVGTTSGMTIWQFYAGRWANANIYDEYRLNAHTGDLYYCFGLPNAPSTNPTFYLNDTDGTLAYDLAGPGLLRATHFGTLGIYTGGMTPSGLPSTFGVMGPQTYERGISSYWDDYWNPGNYEWSHTRFGCGISLNAGGTSISKVETTDNTQTGSGGYDSWPADYTVNYDDSCAVIDLTAL